MFLNNLKIAFRNFLKHKSFSAINLMGLSLGLACFIFIMMYILDELSFDRHFVEADRIVRVEEEGKFGANAFTSCLSPDPLADAIVNDFSEVEKATRLATIWDMWVKHKDLQITEKLLYVDSNFMQVFGIDLLEGDGTTALSKPRSVILSQSAVQRYFGSEEAIGETINIGDVDHQITGVMPDLSENTHFHTDFFVSLAGWDNMKTLKWNNSRFYTYALLKDADLGEIFADKLNQRKRDYFEPMIKEFTSQDFDEFYASGNYINLNPKPLTAIHLYSHNEDEIRENGDIKYIYLFSVIAILILLLACINFINLSTARASDRSKEVGVRKVIGANRRGLVQQFLTESTLMCLSAFFLAMILCQITLPYFNEISNKDLSFGFLFQPMHFVLILSIVAAISLLSGLYPAFFLSGFRPIKAIKGNLNPKGFHNSFRKASVVFQFTITAILLVATIVITQQLHFVQSKKLGYNPEQVFIIRSAWQARGNYGAMKEAIKSMPQVVDVSGTTDLPAQEGGNRNLFFGGEENEGQAFPLNRWWVDYDFFNTLEMGLKEGRVFDNQFGTDTSAVVLNETAAKRFGLVSPYIDQVVYEGEDNTGNAFRVIGVVADFHFRSLHNEIEPLGIFLTRNPTPANLTMRIRTSDLEGFINGAEKVFNKFIPNSVFTYEFFDERFEAMYAQESSISRLFNWFTGLGILIACLGLFGLINYIVRQRTKEIGIRKVLGASVQQVVLLLTKDYLKLIGLALILSIPIAWYGVSQWLENFAYRIELHWSVFLFAGLLTIVVAVVTVGWQSIKAAIANPINSLRSE